MPAKLVALIAAAALTTGWLLASILSPPVAELQGLPARVEAPAPPPESPREGMFTTELHRKLQAAPVAPVPRRNPFVFGSADRRALRDVPPPSAHEAMPEPLPAPVAVGPSLRLSGIGSTTTDSGSVLTAVISDGVTVHLAKLGDTVGGYRVVAITDDSMTIENAAGAQWRLRLR